MQIYACALFDVAGASELAEPTIGEDEWSAKKSLANPNGLRPGRLGSAKPAWCPEIPVASGTLVESFR